MPTANECPGPETVIEHLRKLQTSIATVAAAEQVCVQARAAAATAANREFKQAEENAANQTQARIVALAAAQHQLKDQLEQSCTLRRARIQDAYQRSRNALSQRVQNEKDLRIGRLHGEILRAREQRTAELEQTKSDHREFQKLLTADRERRLQLRDAALSSLRSFRPLLGKAFLKPSTKLPDQDAADAGALHAASRASLDEAAESVAALQAWPMARLFRYLPLSVMLVLAVAVHGFLAFRPGETAVPLWPWLAVTGAVVCGLWLLAWLTSLPPARKAASQLAAARARAILAEKASAAKIATISAAIQHDEQSQSQALSETFRESDETLRQRMAEGFRKLESQVARLPATLDRLYQHRSAKLHAGHEQALARIHAEAEALAQTRTHAREVRIKQAQEAYLTSISALIPDWLAGPATTLETLSSLENLSRSQFPAWNSANCAEWTPPPATPAVVRIGHLEIHPDRLAGAIPDDPRLSLPAPPLCAPLALSFPDHGSLLVESDDGNGAAVLAAVSLRLLASFPPGRASFVFIDPIGLGREFAGLMHLADYEETLIHHRIWTQSTHIEERLAEINEHIEKVIQMYLRNEFATLADYNAQADTIAEKHHFLVIAGFPAAFSDTACKRLLSIASSGARCGVHLLVHHDLRQPGADAALLDELRRVCLRVVGHHHGRRLTNAPAGADVVHFDAPPTPEDTSTLVHRIGRSAIDSNRVEVPFAQIAPAEAEIWSLRTAAELRVPIGRTGAKKLQMLALGKGTRQHALVAGKTGSGKSTLFHVIITNLALWCPPEEVEFYLVDFKKGVEFKCYATHHLPHARVIAIESDRGFALSVLQRVDAELRRRGELFRKAGSQDLPGYLAAPDTTPLPRTLLLIDEFQEFFTEDDPVAQEASLLLDRIVRQGRAFGIHVILGSQTLGGAYTLARATLGQMVVRVALQCNEADAALIMEDDNPAPRLLNRPGEGIYNDQAGTLAANSPFQIVWLPEHERNSRLDQIRGLARRDGKARPAPVVFEGNAPADLGDNPDWLRLRHQPPSTRPATARAWLGAPNSIKGHTEAVFHRQNGSHLLLVGQSAERNLTLLGIAAASLASQFPAGRVEFHLFDPSPDPSFFQSIAAAFPHRFHLVNPVDAPSQITGLAGLLDADGDNPESPERFLIIHEIQRFKCLRPDDEFRFSLDDDAPASASQAFARLLGEGGPAGIHVLAGIDTWNNISRWIPRKLLAEFEMRVLFQMSAGDSANLVDSPAAASLGLHRALLHNEHLGTQETFRPYAMPEDPDWLKPGQPPSMIS
jgi:hypothetical protein